MNKATLSPKAKYQSRLRQEQAALTRDRILAAAASLLDAGGSMEAITFKAVAERAAVTEMTVYRHFPTRADLLRALWARLNDQMGPNLGVPDSIVAMLAQHDQLFAGFDRIAPQIVASITTPQGREMRAALNEERRKGFLAIAEEAAPHLSESRKREVAAILQLLHSAYAWDSLREQWDMNGEAAGKAAKWAIETLLHSLRTSP